MPLATLVSLALNAGTDYSEVLPLHHKIQQLYLEKRAVPIGYACVVTSMPRLSSDPAVPGGASFGLYFGTRDASGPEETALTDVPERNEQHAVLFCFFPKRRLQRVELLVYQQPLKTTAPLLESRGSHPACVR